MPIRAPHDFKERRHRFDGQFVASNYKEDQSGLGRRGRPDHGRLEIERTCLSQGGGDLLA